MTAPRCHNRPDPAPGRWVQNGYCPKTLRTRLRWSPAWALPGCKTWDGTGIGPNNERYPVAHGWVEHCKTCRWLPAFAKEEMGL